VIGELPRQLEPDDEPEDQGLARQPIPFDGALSVSHRPEADRRSAAWIEGGVRQRPLRDSAAAGCRHSNRCP
jgi:hypothetical protein